MNDTAKDNRKNIGEVFLSAKGLCRDFGSGKSKTVAVNNVDFEFRRGEIISIVGESGSGKTTLAKMVLGLLSSSAGEIIFEGKPRDISTQSKRRLYWQNIQAIFQDPFSTYNIFNKVDEVLMDCIRLKSGRLQSGRLQGGGNLSKEEKFERMKDACSFVNLKFEELSNKYPFELSGGQMQRLMIARIFMLKPKLLIADEPTSMIDACSRATILDMMLKLRDEIDMTIVFITHDIGLAYYISDTVYIMEHGVIVEQGTADQAILHPTSDYTKRLLGDVPKIYEPWDFRAG
ncbi:MAG: ABC transporter ATP-binding protein [Treponema sp.]|jgi:peptide/nickel transport system ATP-binding protein|nr:ABC transporter ATP-binding protein [Treponema sp.]